MALMEEPINQKKKGLLDRPVRLFWPFTLFIVFAVVICIGWFYHINKIANLRYTAKHVMKEEIRQKAEALGQTIAVTSRDDIRNSDFNKLQEYFIDIAKNNPDIEYLVVMKLNGEAVVHTDTKFRGKKLQDSLAQAALDADDVVVSEVDDKSLYDVAVPVMGFTSKAAVIRVGASFERSKQAFEAKPKN